MHLFLEEETRLEGQIEWTFKISPVPREQVNIGKRGIEYVRGSYDSRSQSVVLQGYNKHDPDGVIGIDEYKLKLSGNLLSGQSRNRGTWTGKFTAERVKP